MNAFFMPLRGALVPLQQTGVKPLLRSLLPALRHANRAQISRHTLLNLWQQYGDRDAIISAGERITFKVFSERVVRLANLLHKQGLSAGDSVALLTGNGSFWFEAMAATTLLGISMPLINWHLSAAETSACIRLSGAQTLLISDQFIDRLEPALRQELKLIAVMGEAVDGLPALDDLITQTDTQLPSGGIGFSPKLFSGGTTGTPKFIQLDSQTLSRRRSTGSVPSKATLARLAWKLLSLPILLKLDKVRDPQSHNIRSLVCNPLYHSGAQATALPIFLGGTVVIMEKFSASEFLRLIERERINWTFVTPTMLERILALPAAERQRYNLSSLQVLMCSAAPCPANVKQEINLLFRQQGNQQDVFHEFYGSSEAGPVTVLVPQDYRDDPQRYHSVGKARAGDCKVLDVSTGRWAEAHQIGKVLLRSPAVYILAYGGKSEAEMRTHFVEVDGTPWYDDGLAGYLDEHGFLYITGRDKEMLIIGGVNIYTNEIEFALKSHPDVLDAAVVALPDSDLGEVAVAVVSWHQGAAYSDEASLIEFCKAQGLYGFKLPRRIVITDELPRDAAGKLRKKQIQERYFPTQ